MDKSPNTKMIAENIRAACMAARISPEKLAELAGYETETVLKYLNGYRQPKLAMSYRFARAIGCSAERFLRGIFPDAGKPHGRLIDADKLAEVIREAQSVEQRIQLAAQTGGDASGKKELRAETAIYVFSTVLHEIEIAPTIAEAET